MKTKPKTEPGNLPCNYDNLTMPPEVFWYMGLRGGWIEKRGSNYYAMDDELYRVTLPVPAFVTEYEDAMTKS